MHQCSIAVTKISSVCCTMENEANYGKFHSQQKVNNSCVG